MAQAIKNIKAGQRFLVIDKEEIGFKENAIVEALESKNNIDENIWFYCRWIGGDKSYMDKILMQNIKHLKRYKGKIK